MLFKNCLALDDNGFEYERQPRYINELGHDLINDALKLATKSISKILCIEPKCKIMFGAPVYEAFMSATEAKKLKQSKHGDLLYTHGSNIKLDLCNF